MDQAERRLAELTVELEYVQSLVVVLCVYTLPDRVLDGLIEELDIPELGDTAESLRTRVKQRLADKLAKGRVRKRRSR